MGSQILVVFNLERYLEPYANAVVGKRQHWQRVDSLPCYNYIHPIKELIDDAFPCALR